METLLDILAWTVLIALGISCSVVLYEMIKDSLRFFVAVSVFYIVLVVAATWACVRLFS